MATVARLEASLAFKDAEFTAGIARAEQRAQTFGSRMEHTLSRAFRRDPAHRAERAITGSLASLAQGDIAGAIGGISGKMAGLGVIAGVGIGLAVEGFLKLKESVHEVTEAHDKLDAEMRKPIDLASAKAFGAALDDLEKKQNTVAHRITGFLSDIAHQKGFGGLTDLGKSRMEEVSENAKADQKRKEVEASEGRRELVKANVMSGIGDDPRRAALAKARLETEDKIKDIQRANQDKPDAGAKAKIAALEVEGAQIEKNYKAQKDLFDASQESRMREIAIAAQGLDPEREKLALIREQIRALDERLKLTTNPEERANLRIGRAGKEVELRRNLFAQAKADIEKTPEQRESDMAAQFRDKHLAETFANRGRIMPSDRDLATQQGAWEAHLRMGTWDSGSTGGTTGEDKSITKSDLDDVMAKYWK